MTVAKHLPDAWILTCNQLVLTLDYTWNDL